MPRPLVTAVAACVVLHAGGAHAQSSLPARRMEPSPAFTAEQLTALPRTNWVTNGGNVFNRRYSPLTELDRFTVGELEALWRTSMGSGATPNNSGQAQILVFEGVLYVVNGANDVFAMDVDTGEILWTYHGNPDPRARVPMGKSSRGVAMGDGKIFLAQLDARLVALDQRTGEVVWSIAAERWQNGSSITSAPLYYDGLVITGFSGGELASRGRVKAFDADDGGHGGGPTLIAGLPVETIAEVARTGRNTMPEFGTVYSASDLRDVTADIAEVLAKEPSQP